MANTPKFNKLSHAINGGLENLEKWYHKTNNTNAYFICLGKCSQFFDINIINVYFQHSIRTGSSHTQKNSRTKNLTTLGMKNLTK